jgi:hypothetical protein
MQQPTDPKSNPLKSKTPNFISQDRISLRKDVQSSYSNKLSGSNTPDKNASQPAKRGRKKYTSSDPFEDLNFSWEKTDYNDDHFESSERSRSKSKNSEEGENDSYFYGDGYTESDDQNNYESFSRG